MIEETGIVIKTNGIMARVSVQKRGACEGCTVRGVCETAEDAMEIEALNPVHASTGQTVKVSIKPQTYLRGALIVYGIPLVAFIGGIIAGKNIGERYFMETDSDIIAFIAGFVLLAASLLLVKIWSRRTETKVEYKPVVEEILQ